MAAVGETDIKEKLKQGNVRAIGRRYKVHLDGYNFLPHFKNAELPGPRKEFIYTSDTGDIIGIRDGDFKIVFKEQRGHGVHVWQDPWTPLRAPKIFNLRMDPFERADYEAAGYPRWWGEHMFLFAPAMVKVAEFKATFEEFPQRQKPGSFVP